jgi:hypothetical protein
VQTRLGVIDLIPAQPDAIAHGRATINSSAKKGAGVMTRQDAERKVWDEWRSASERDMGCAMQPAPELTEEHEWGWVVFLAPVRLDECRQLYPYARFACERRGGRSLPVGTKGLEQALLLLGVVTEADWSGPQAEVEAMWSRRTRRYT